MTPTNDDASTDLKPRVRVIEEAAEPIKVAIRVIEEVVEPIKVAVKITAPTTNPRRTPPEEVAPRHVIKLTATPTNPRRTPPGEPATPWRSAPSQDGGLAKPPTSAPSVVNTALSELSSVAHRLNRKSDELNTTIASLDARLRDTAIGLSAWTQVILDERDRAEYEGGIRTRIRSGWSLGYTKVDDVWTIAVMRMKSEVDNDGDAIEWRDDEPIALLKAPRHVRVEAAEHFDALIRAVSERAKSFIEGIDKATALVA